MIGQLRIAFLILATVMLSTFLCAHDAFAQEHAAAHPHWSYTGQGAPAHWGDLDPGFELCEGGKRQSPIDIHGARTADLQPIQFDYMPLPLKIINNGHSIQVNVQSGGGIKIGGTQYSLVQFHFHKPSEEEVGGKQFDMVAHLVHRDVAGNLAVVAVLFKSGKENPSIQTLWNNLPPDEGKEYAPRNVKENVSDLLPADQNYYTFAGSLTTPPCTEGVTWYVLRSPVEISPAQIAAFGKFYPNNARPLQPTNGREILASHFKK
jgi:carbonic anhydrase